MPRLMEIAISQELFQEIMTDGWSTEGKVIVCEGGLPEGAELVHSYFERGGIAYLVFQHESFEDVHRLEPLPRLHPVFRQVSR